MHIWPQMAWRVSPSVTGKSVQIFGVSLYFVVSMLTQIYGPRVQLVAFTCVVPPLRWLLLGFQREFEHSEALRLFEILSCDHLELISQQVNRARYLERLAQKTNAGKVHSWRNKRG